MGIDAKIAHTKYSVIKSVKHCKNLIYQERLSAKETEKKIEENLIFMGNLRHWQFTFYEQNRDGRKLGCISTTKLLEKAYNLITMYIL